MPADCGVSSRCIFRSSCCSARRLAWWRFLTAERTRDPCTRKSPMETRRTFLRKSGLVIAGLSSLPFTPATAGDAAQLDSQALTLEAARVLWELHAFERVYLPALLGPGQPASPSPALARWKRAVRLMRRAVPRAGRCQSTPHTETIRNACSAAAPGCGDFLVDSPSECFSRISGRICWHIYPYFGQGVAEREEQVRFVLRWAGVGDERAVAPWLE